MNSTTRLQMMLFKAVGVQLLVGYIFLLFPTAIICFSFYSQTLYGNTIANFCLILMTTHGSVDYITMMYFITPYRRIVIGWIISATNKTNPSYFGGKI